MRVLARDDLARLFETLRAEGRTVLGPTARDGAITMDALDGPDDLPIGWSAAQGPGTYRLREDGSAVFGGYVVGPDSPKRLLAPARETLYTVEQRPDGRIGFVAQAPATDDLALLGVRACDLSALAIQERVFSHGPYRDPKVSARRERALVVAVNCTRPGDLCFCASTGSGPRVRPREDAGQADVVLTERDGGFLVEAHTEDGRAMVDALPTAPATAEDEAWVEAAMDEARGAMGRTVDLDGLPEILFGRLDHPRWADVAERCLSCGNCTSVCPTCFCTTTEHRLPVDGTEPRRERLWDSCFTEGHAYIHGAALRTDVEDRYRQWLTHKVGSWVTQFGTSGCVGCGRCIAWCPVGIDLTEEIAALREGEGRATLPAPSTYGPAEPADLAPQTAEVVAVTRETHNVVTLHLRPEDPAPFAPGQFHQLAVPGVGEVPISVSGHDGASLEHTVRAAGATTQALVDLQPGQMIGIRGPFGRPWPLEEIAGRPVVVIAGGIGLAPLRAALRAMLEPGAPYPSVTLLYGARRPDDALYLGEMLGWMADPRFRLRMTVDHATPGWRGHVGVVTRLIGPGTVPPDAAALICGPEVMMRFTVEALREVGIPDDRIWVTMERHMECATGFCGRCQLGPYFLCKDGPVFRFDQVRMVFGRKGF
ncbi:MAG: 4Fe-4S dicluster domain-containing protein [Sandaracinaceae bacterium]